MEAANQSTLSPGKMGDQKPKRGNGLRIGIVAAAAVAVVVVLALALGLGLGLGLKSRNHNGSDSQGSSSDDDSFASQAIPPWRESTEQYLLDMSWNINAPPTTRMYNFTVGEVSITPDGIIRWPQV
jgi:hypothetical protein